MILVDREKVIIAGEIRELFSEILVVLLQIAEQGEDTSSYFSKDEIIQIIFDNIQEADEILSSEKGDISAAISNIKDELFGGKSDAKNALQKAMASMQTPFVPTEAKKKKKKKDKKNKKTKKDHKWLKRMG